MRLKKKRLKDIIARFKRQRILVVGDLILDHYIFGKVERISPEAPVPVLWANRESFVCGGAANVGRNLVSLGAYASLGGIVGRDYFGGVLFSHIKKAGLDSSLIIRDMKRPTTLKTRVIAHHQQIVRLDWESTESLSVRMASVVLRRLERRIRDFDAVIIEDYGKGVINSYTAGELVGLCQSHKKIVTVDPKEEHFDYYSGVTSLTPNLKEAQNAVNMKIKSKDQIPLVGKMIMERLKPKSLLITLGEEGMMLFADHRNYHIPTAAMEVFDVTGAGDTVIATFTLALASGASFYEAAELANFAAGIVVGKLGAAATTPKELLKRIYAE